MTKAIALNALKFLERVELKWTEAWALYEVQQSLMVIVQQEETTKWIKEPNGDK